MSLDKYGDLGKDIRDHIDRAVGAIGRQSDILAGLPAISTVSEIAGAFRASDDVIRSMTEGGMPHFHAGRELRFNKALLIEWQITGRKYSCEICAAKKSPAVPKKPEQPPKPSNITSISSKAGNKLAKMAGVKLQ